MERFILNYLFHEFHMLYIYFILYFLCIYFLQCVLVTTKCRRSPVLVTYTNLLTGRWASCTVKAFRFFFFKKSLIRNKNGHVVPRA